MKFKIIGPIACTRSGTASEISVCPATFTTSVMGYSALGFVGTESIPLKKEVVFDLMTTSVDQGINFFYASDTKVGGTEFLMGELIESMRDRVILVAKHKGKSSPANIRLVFDEHCSQFRTDYIDIYGLEYDSSVPIEESMGSMKTLLDNGKIKGIALSGIGLSTDLIERAYAIFPITAVQVSYSLWNRTVEQSKIFETCKRLGIVCIACTGAEMEFVPRTAKTFEPESHEERKALEGLQKLAKDKGVSPAQLELAWIRHQGCFAFVTNLNREALLESTRSTAIKLLPADIALLDTLFPIGTASFATAVYSSKKSADTPSPTSDGPK